MNHGIHIAIELPDYEGTPSRVVVGIAKAVGFNGLTIEEIPAGEQAPTLFLPNDIARPLLDALAQHYGGTSDTRTLRKDYEAERARVDRLIDAGGGTVVTRSHGQCMAPSPALTIGTFYFRGDGCRRDRWHFGVHRNTDDTTWGRWLQARMRLNRMITGSAYP